MKEKRKKKEKSGKEDKDIVFWKKHFFNKKAEMF